MQNFTLFHNFADPCLQNEPLFLISRPHWKNTPLFAKMGISVVYVLVGGGMNCKVVSVLYIKIAKNNQPWYLLPTFISKIWVNPQPQNEHVSHNGSGLLLESGLLYLHGAPRWYIYTVYSDLSFIKQYPLSGNLRINKTLNHKKFDHFFISWFCSWMRIVK